MFPKMTMRPQGADGKEAIICHIGPNHAHSPWRFPDVWGYVEPEGYLLDNKRRFLTIRRDGSGPRATVGTMGLGFRDPTMLTVMLYSPNVVEPPRPVTQKGENIPPHLVGFVSNWVVC